MMNRTFLAVAAALLLCFQAKARESKDTAKDNDSSQEQVILGKGRKIPQTFIMMPVESMESTAAKMREFVTGLDDRQYEKIRSISARAMKKMSREAKKYEKKILSVLTEEQRAELEQE